MNQENNCEPKILFSNHKGITGHVSSHPGMDVSSFIRVAELNCSSLHVSVWCTSQPWTFKGNLSLTCNLRERRHHTESGIFYDEANTSREGKQFIGLIFVQPGHHTHFSIFPFFLLVSIPLWVLCWPNCAVVAICLPKYINCHSLMYSVGSMQTLLYFFLFC